MRIIVIDCSVSGHRETYYKQFAATCAELGHATLLIAPEGNQLSRRVVFEPISSKPLLPLPSSNSIKKKLTVLRNAFIRLRNLNRLSRQIRKSNPDLLFFACLDDMLPTMGPLWLFHLLLPYKWSGLLVQSDLPDYKPGMPDTRPYLQSKNCLGVGILNEYSADKLKVFQQQIVLFPDFADLCAPDTSYELLEKLIAKAGKRKIIALLGSINSRKGIKLLQQCITLLPKDEYFFLIAGKSSLTAQQENDLRMLESSRSNCLVSLNKIPDESCFNALVAFSHVIFTAYTHFKGSSNLLTKAAAFCKPVVVSKGYCMGKRVEKYGTGKVIREDNAEECCEAIRSLCTEYKIDIQPFARYRADHELDKLTVCFNKIINRIP